MFTSTVFPIIPVTSWRPGQSSVGLPLNPTLQRLTCYALCFRQAIEKKYKFCGALHKLVIGFKYAYDIVRKEVFYIVLMYSAIPMKEVSLPCVALELSVNSGLLTFV